MLNGEANSTYTQLLEVLEGIHPYLNVTEYNKGALVREEIMFLQWPRGQLV